MEHTDLSVDTKTQKKPPTQVNVFKHLQLCVLGLREKKEKTMFNYVSKALTCYRKAHPPGKSLTQQIYHSLISTSYLFKMVFQHY